MLAYWYVRITNNTTRRILKMKFETALESSKLVITYRYLISDTRIFYDTCGPSNIDFVVNCPIDRVWEFYTDIKHLEIISPTEIELKIISATSQKLIQGSEF